MYKKSHEDVRKKSRTNTKSLAVSIIQKRWRSNNITKMIEVKCQVLEKLKCSICMDFYRTFNRCANSHGVCESCYENMADSACPLCRATINDIAETLTADIAQTLNIRVVCGTCDKCYPIEKIEHHRNWCDEHLFNCPAKEICTRKFKASELYDHLVHHDKNTITVKDYSSSIIMTHINPYDNFILVGLEETKHVLMFCWNGIRSDLGIPLIGLSARCYYPSQDAKKMSLKVIHRNACDEQTSISETFFAPEVEPMFPNRDTTHIAPFGIVTPSVQFKNENFVGTIQVLKSEEDAIVSISKHKRELQPYDNYSRQVSKRKFISMLCSSQRDATAFVNIYINLENEPISKVFP